MPPLSVITFTELITKVAYVSHPPPRDLLPDDEQEDDGPPLPPRPRKTNPRVMGPEWVNTLARV